MAAKRCVYIFWGPYVRNKGIKGCGIKAASTQISVTLVSFKLHPLT
jgi:hypothetical protein